MSFSNAIYGGTTASGDYDINLTSGVKLNVISQLQPTPLLSESKLDYYTEQYMLRGQRGWYRVAEPNWADGLARKSASLKIEMPALFIGAESDSTVPPSLADGIGKILRNLRTELVQAGHWTLRQAEQRLMKRSRLGWLMSLKINMDR